MTLSNNIEMENNESARYLRKLGWNDSLEQDLKAADGHPDKVGRVMSAQRNLFLVSNGQTERLCSPSGKLMHCRQGGYPVTGDWVLTDGDVIKRVLYRNNILCRGEAGARGKHAVASIREQPIAANVDMVFIVCGLDRDYNIRRIERYMALVYNCAMAPVIVLTKADLADDPYPFCEEVETIAFGVPVVLTSIKDGRGIGELHDYLGEGRTVAMLGSSGAGKSSLANMLYGSDIQLTAEVSSSVGKGRHTTTTRELIIMPRGGLLMDNPGIREIGFSAAGDGLETAFSDIQELAESCRFSNCSHLREPGCAVLQAVESGALSTERLESYHKMQREMDYVQERSKKSADRLEKERWKDVAMEIKRINKRR